MPYSARSCQQVMRRRVMVSSSQMASIDARRMRLSWSLT